MYTHPKMGGAPDPLLHLLTLHRFKMDRTPAHLRHLKPTPPTSLCPSPAVYCWRYLSPSSFLGGGEDARRAGQGACAGAQVHMHAPDGWPCTLVDIHYHPTSALPHRRTCTPQTPPSINLCPMRDLVCVSSALHRLDTRSRHTSCTAALAGQACGARRRKPRSGSASTRSMAVGCTRTGSCLHFDVFAFGTPPFASLCSLLCYAELCLDLRLTARGSSHQDARSECRASCCSAPLMSTVIVHARWCRSCSCSALVCRWARQALGHSAVGRTHGVQQPLRVAAMYHRRGRGST